MKKRPKGKKSRGGDKRISHFHVKERGKKGEVGGEKINKAALKVLLAAYCCHLFCIKFSAINTESMTKQEHKLKQMKDRTSE